MLTLFRLFVLALVGWCLGIMVYATVITFGGMAAIATALIPALVLRINHEVQRAHRAEQARKNLEATAQDELSRRRAAKQSNSTNMEA